MTALRTAIKSARYLIAANKYQAAYDILRQLNPGSPSVRTALSELADAALVANPEITATCVLTLGQNKIDSFFSQMKKSPHPRALLFLAEKAKTRANAATALSLIDDRTYRLLALTQETGTYHFHEARFNLLLEEGLFDVAAEYAKERPDDADNKQKLFKAAVKEPGNEIAPLLALNWDKSQLRQLAEYALANGQVNSAYRLIADGKIPELVDRLVDTLLSAELSGLMQEFTSSWEMIWKLQGANPSKSIRASALSAQAFQEGKYDYAFMFIQHLPMKIQQDTAYSKLVELICKPEQPKADDGALARSLARKRKREALNYALEAALLIEDTDLLALIMETSRSNGPVRAHFGAAQALGRPGLKKMLEWAKVDNNQQHIGLASAALHSLKSSYETHTPPLAHVLPSPLQLTRQTSNSSL